MREALFGHMPTKLAALALAILTYSYLFNRGNRATTELLRISTDQQRPSEPHIIIGAGPDAIVRLESPVQTIRLEIEGLESEVERFVGRNLVGSVDLSRFVPSDGQPANRVPLSPKDITFRNKPASVTLGYPDQLPAVLVSVRRTWPVQITVLVNELQPHPKYQVTGSSVDPAEILLTGPSEFQRSLTRLEIPAEALEMFRPDASFEKTFLKNQLTTLISEAGVEVAGDTSVTVQVELRPNATEKEIFVPYALIVTNTIDGPSGEVLSVFGSDLKIKLDSGGDPLPEDRVPVVFRGPEDALDEVAKQIENDKPSSQYRVLFDLTKFLQDDLYLPENIGTLSGIIVDLPEGVTFDPITVNVSQEP